MMATPIVSKPSARSAPQVFRQFAWNLAGTLAQKTGVKAKRQQSSPTGAKRAARK